MTCWKTLNISREYGQHRLTILSIFLGIISFIVLYIPFSILHQNAILHDPALWQVMLGLLTLPILHKLAHAFPITFTSKEFKLKWYFKYRYIPLLKLKVRSSLSKRTSIIMMLAPTVVITVPLLIGATVFPMFYPILIVFASIHIGISLTDWLILSFFIKAPKKCIVEKTKNNYDILVQSP
ncbi:magnesium-transporting ATPase (P-type) [Alkalibacillus filiformis]|uniref:Magnesium-transporting ATPase (P-type) n=1 Tax=Alkalibacillus filiformis TaxID=200990 RepID=A0ABU0DT84_9BACI|nr:DUF3267 domain-containing protein [Alkalibacillus filiformis]MDQ0351668.1 magnesium-transporting ATPase (P-type) [Alkalibacillus filiformis]